MDFGFRQLCVFQIVMLHFLPISEAEAEEILLVML